MILLDDIDEILEIVSNSSSNLDVNITYRDVRDGIGSTSKTIELKISAAATNSILTNPPPGTRRYIDFLSIVNTGISTARVILQKNKGGIKYQIKNQVMLPGSTYKNVAGRDFFDEAGAAVVSSGSIMTEVVTAEDFAGFEVINGDGTIADSAVITKRNKAIGIITGPYLTGFTGEVITQGSIENSAWSWTAGDRLFLNGTSISTVAPVAGFNQLIAVAITPTIIEVDIKQSILL